MSDAIESLTNRDKALRGEVVVVTDARLGEMRKQAIYFEGVVEGSFHWHLAAALNELASLRKAGSAAVPASDFAALEAELATMTELRDLAVADLFPVCEERDALRAALEYALGRLKRDQPRNAEAAIMDALAHKEGT